MKFPNNCLVPVDDFTSIKQVTVKLGFRYIPCCRSFIMKTRLFKNIENFTFKTENIQIKNPDIFHISARNIDCGYSLEPPRQGGSNEYHNLFFEQK